MKDQETTTSAIIIKNSKMKKPDLNVYDYELVSKEDEKIYETKKVRAKRVVYKTV